MSMKMLILAKHVFACREEQQKNIIVIFSSAGSGTTISFLKHLKVLRIKKNSMYEMNELFLFKVIKFWKITFTVYDVSDALPYITIIIKGISTQGYWYEKHNY